MEETVTTCDVTADTTTEDNAQVNHLPSIESRLAVLRPSKALLDYYRAKISQYDGEFEQLAGKLDEFRTGCQDQERLTSEVALKEDEVTELQKALSDMQACLFQEREQVLRLYSENDRLKLRELEDRKKIQHLLSLTGTGEGGDITYFHKEPPAKVIIPQYRRPNTGLNYSTDSFVSESTNDDISLRKAVPSKVKSKDTRANASFNSANGNANRRAKSSKTAYKSREIGAGDSRPQLPEELERGDVEILRLQVEALQAQLEDQTKLAKEQIDSLMEERRNRHEEMTATRQREANKIRELSDRLAKTQQMLYEATKEGLGDKAEVRRMETKWIHEKDRLLRELDEAREKLSTSQHRKVEMLSESIHTMEVTSVSQRDTIQGLQNQLAQSQTLADMYREQIITLEDEMSRVREEGSIGKQLFKERTEKMAKRLQLVNQRYEALEQRRGLEVEGFKNDVKILRSRLRDVERQLCKVTLQFAQPLIREDKDVELLHNVKQSNARTKNMMGQLHDLKAKVYGLESDLRNL